MKEKYTTAQIIEALREKHGNMAAAAIQRWADMTGGIPVILD